jgi:hypothetical protein
MKERHKSSSQLTLLKSTREYFAEVIHEALEKRRLSSPPKVTEYLVDLLDTRVLSDNVNEKQTLAETLLRAIQADRAVRHEMLKNLGDTSLYISGVFGDSLRRKVIDIDYYASIGGVAYQYLASEMTEKSKVEVFKEFSERFMDYVDVLAFVGQMSGLQSNTDLLRLYERYIATGSLLAKEQLVEKGLLTDIDKKKVAQ